jgi:hypothetical protein
MPNAARGSRVGAGGPDRAVLAETAVVTHVSTSQTIVGCEPKLGGDTLYALGRWRSENRVLLAVEHGAPGITLQAAF